MKICPKCNSTAPYDPYFKAYICRHCGWSEHAKAEGGPMSEVRLIDEATLINEAETGGWDVDIKELKMILKYVPEINAVPVVRGEWNYTIKKGSCMDYSVTAKCSKCGWDWFSKDGVGNYSAVFGAFIINGDSKPEEAERFLLENARANNKLNYCPNCGAKMEDKPCG